MNNASQSLIRHPLRALSKAVFQHLTLPATFLVLACSASAPGQVANDLASNLLGKFDINGDGVADGSADTDRDGLPDTWEVGGVDTQQTDVPFPAPQAIVPGTPPTSIFNRRPVRTSATLADTDNDGLSDFIEVFGLKFIDDNGNGILDADEWNDANGDGLPSIGEWPLPNALPLGGGQFSEFDFDGFVFTDPTNPDTDGDGVLDGLDNDPLVNPRAFGLNRAFFSSGGGPLASDQDRDNDGLGNGMDLGNDALRGGEVDNPTDLQRVIEIFRPDLIFAAGAVVRVPEGLIEDLLGADWNGDGLFRLTDVVRPAFGITTKPNVQAGGIDLFELNEMGVKTPLFATTRFPFDIDPERPIFNRNQYVLAAHRGAGGVTTPLPLQRVLQPAGRADNVFLPDPRIWTVLYAWRMPGFDIDGNGFIGFDGKTFSGKIEVNGQTITVDPNTAEDNQPSSELIVTPPTSSLDGRIDPPAFCASLSFATIAFAVVGLVRARPRRSR